jgi:uncharacterized protein (TIGR04255 family)
MPAVDPFLGPAPAEVGLSHAPLARVIAQVRFPPILALDKPEEVSGFQKAIRADYPLLRRDEVREIEVAPLGNIKVTTGVVWKFSDAREEWQVSLSTTFVALETRAYTSRADFLTRLDAVVRAADAAFTPQVVERLGIRYVNRIQGSPLDRLSLFVRPEMLGVVLSPIAAHVRLNITETHLELPGGVGQMLIRHGRLPPQATYDPEVIQPDGASSWVLDIDTYQAERGSFDPWVLSELLRGLADQAYRLFRWVVTDDFLKEHGGAS